MKLKMQQIEKSIKESFQKNFMRATPEFIFILIFVNVFQAVFGTENSIVGVIFTIMMSASMVRDMTAAPFKHLLIQTAVLFWMGISACLVTTLNPWAALPINLATVFVILYAFTYEYASHMYFPYILSYLFLVFISPVSLERLPRRLLGLMVGAVCIILYQLIKGNRRVEETTQDVLTAMLDEGRAAIAFQLTGEGAPSDLEAVRHTLCRLSRSVYERRKRVLCVSDASFALIDAGRGMEHLIILLNGLKKPLTQDQRMLLRQTDLVLEQDRAFLQRSSKQIEPLNRAEFGGGDIETDVYNALDYIREHLLHMTDPEKRTRFRPTALSLKERLKAALDVSYVRIVYAARVAVLLAVFTFVVQRLQLLHGKWLLFTLASLSLPYADDVGPKIKKRIAATLLGGLVSVAAYALVPSSAGRTAVMMLSGYVSFYFSDYTSTYACSTVGALGGAVFANAFTFGEVGQIFLIRVCYICVGAVIALVANSLLCPFSRSRATHLLLERYAFTTDLLTRVVSADQVDTQLYYSLVIQAHLQEDKLAQNAQDGGWEELQAVLARCRGLVRRAHRHRMAG